MRRLRYSLVTRPVSSLLASRPSTKDSTRPFSGAAKVVKRSVDATTDEITSELQEALKG